MDSLKLKQVDVFTTGFFKGAPVGVVMEAGSLKTDQMQSIAKEIANSQTVFITDSSFKGMAKARFFTPKTEVKVSGQATLALAHALIEDSHIFLNEPVSKLDVMTNIGTIQVEIIIKKEKIKRISVILPKPVFENISLETKTLASSLDIKPESIITETLPFQIVDIGLKIIIVYIKDMDTMKSIMPNLKKIEKISSEFNIDGIYAFCLNAENPLAFAHARFFAPNIGVAEDSATGTAAGALGAYLLNFGFIRGSSPISLVLEQGLEMGRPSEILVEVIFDNGTINELKVGGKTKTAIEGEIIIGKEEK